MNKFINKSKYIGLIETIIGIISLTVLNGFMVVSIFLDMNTFVGLSYVLYFIVLGVSLIGSINYILANYISDYQDKKIFVILNKISFVMIVIHIILIIASFIAINEYMISFLDKIYEDIIYPIIGLVLFTSYFIYNETNKKVKLIYTISLMVVLILATINIFFPFKAFKINSDPAVFDNGSNYTVTFSTSTTSIGYIEYKENNEYIKIWDSANGKKNNSEIHSIKLDYEILDNNTYRIGAIRTIEEYANGGKIGKEIKSKEYNFKKVEGTSFKALSISDYHGNTKYALDALSYIDNYDVIFFLGDASVGVTSIKELKNYYIDFMGSVSKGSVPIIYSRGNHDTRGKYASYIIDIMGYDNLYYRKNIGNYSFIVLDSAEDKMDSHIEYSGYNEFDNERIKQLDWLNSLNKEEYTNICISHMSFISIYNEQMNKSYNKLVDLDCKLIISGHTHKTLLSRVSNGNEIINVFEDGGKLNNEFTCSLIEFNDEIKITSYNNKGEITPIGIMK